MKDRLADGTPLHYALLFMDVATGGHAVHCVKERRGKVYDMWVDPTTHEKIIACRQLEAMGLVEFITWLTGCYRRAQIVFPEPEVYRNLGKGIWKE